MIHQIALSTVFGVPLVVYGGIFTLLSFAFTAYIGYTNHKHTEHHLPFAWHPIMVAVSFAIALIHMIFGLSIFMNF
jgi:fructose-specific phosphotransferase system IIC component